MTKRQREDIKMAVIGADLAAMIYMLTVISLRIFGVA